MQDTSTSPRSATVKRLLMVCIAVLVLAGVSIGTVFLLKNIVPKKEAASTIMDITADEVVGMYRVPGVISGLSDSLYDQQLDDDTSVPVAYKLASHAYSVSTQTSSNVLFYSKTPSPQDDTKAIQDQTAVFMRSKGYEKADSLVTSDASKPARARYVSKSAVCELTSSGTATPKGSPASHQLACVENSAIDDEYKAVEKLLDLYVTDKKPTFTEAVRSFVSEGNKAYAILRLTTEQKPPALLFASLNDEWAYLGNLSGGDGAGNAKYVITPEIKAKISDSKYGNFLTKNLQGGSSS